MTSPTWPVVQGNKGRMLVVLVLDTSHSMHVDDAIGQLNRALNTWRQELWKDSYLRRIAEIAVVTFGADGVRTIDPAGGDGPLAEPFVPIDRFNPPALAAAGFSPMVPAIKQATTLVNRRRRALEGSGIQMAHPPLVYLLTDGAPSDEHGRPCQQWRNLVPELRRQEELKELRFFAFGVRGADPEVLRELAPRRSYQVDGADFTQVLMAVRQSIDRVMSSKRVDDEIQANAESMEAVRVWLESQGRQP